MFSLFKNTSEISILFCLIVLQKKYLPGFTMEIDNGFQAKNAIIKLLLKCNKINGPPNVSGVPLQKSANPSHYQSPLPPQII